MTQQVIKLRVIIPTTNVEMDNISNDFVIEATGSDTTIDQDTGGVQAAINTFYNSNVTGQTNALSQYLSSEYSTVAEACSIEWYDITAHLSGTPAGSPIRIDSFTNSGGPLSGTDLHPALALVGAYRRDYGTDLEHSGSTRPRARDRGRLYIGPLNAFAQNDGTGKAKPVAATDVIVAMKHLATTHNSGSANQWNWVQWSRKNASVGNIAFAGSQYGLGLQRRRADEQATRVLSWSAV